MRLIPLLSPFFVDGGDAEKRRTAFKYLLLLLFAVSKVSKSKVSGRYHKFQPSKKLSKQSPQQVARKPASQPEQRPATVLVVNRTADFREKRNWQLRGPANTQLVNLAFGFGLLRVLAKGN